MLNCSASLAMSTCVLKALPGKLDIKRYSPSILYIFASDKACQLAVDLSFDDGTAVEDCNCISPCE